MPLSPLVNQVILKEGLIPLGIVPLSYLEDFTRFEKWLSEGKHAGLHFLETNNHCRKNPRELLKNAESAIVFGLAYFQGDGYPLKNEENPRTAQYARFKDYHELLKAHGRKIIGELKRIQEFQNVDFRVVVDSAPLLERALAKKTAQGFIGKNTCFIHPKHGSFLLLGEILTTLSIESTELIPKAEMSCGTCTLCQVECPTNALSEDYVIDSNLCLSYWTIEHRGVIPEKFWPWLKEYYFGCDICQLVCPFNKEASSNELSPSINRRQFPTLFEIATMNQAQYETWFGGTPMTRAKRSGLRRNALIAMCEMRNPRLQEAIDRVVETPEYPLVETIEQIKKRLQKTSEAQI